MTATPSLQSSVPTFSLATLRAALAELTAERPERACRLQRAAYLVAFRVIERAETPGCWWVQSETDDAQQYFVVDVGGGRFTCRCPDAERRGHPCKHSLAVMLHQRAERRDAEATDPTGDPANVTAFPERAYSDDECFVLTPKGQAALGDPDPDPPAGPPLGPAWGECRYCGDPCWLAPSGAGACCIG
jgi:hypothetical protein